MSRIVHAAVAVFSLVIGVAPAVGSPLIVDQQNAVFNRELTDLNVFQTFTPTLNRIDADEFSLNATGRTTQLSVEDDLTNALGMSAPPLVANTAGFETVQFDLIEPVALTPGKVYTLRLDLLEGNGLFGFRVSTANPYAGGSFAGSEDSFETWDLVLAEGTHSPSRRRSRCWPLAHCSLQAAGASHNRF